ncbi:ribose 5-phosphate isomerase B [Dysgonomonas sp. Marseille-P4677]|uniref:ribose 5-phosphate isomerase B n=1 Tax=Dysgonomonas sp. Marseille-P4677 TaxID=2364790 RepID=UPI0019120323|nr:ribose 5-phosphate isomerase B [Dysgonomonas sp. Marseille-P4677]MBK5723114.1 ribose 5-phosphate isomerase B [Dysgonomonas sp. Marseille-P4677]
MALFHQGEKPIGLASDHAGFPLKKYIIDLFDEQGIKYTDFGAYSTESVDYPDFAHKLGKAIDNKECDFGIAICGTGNGINMALNKHLYIRAALCWNREIAKLVRMHNDANVLVMPGRFITQKEALEMVITFFNTTFEGGRHQTRIDKIPCK